MRVAQQTISHRGVRDEHGCMQIMRARSQYTCQACARGYTIKLDYGSPYAAHGLDHAHVPLLFTQEPAVDEAVYAPAPAQAYDVAFGDVLLQIACGERRHLGEGVGGLEDLGVPIQLSEDKTLA